MPAGSAFLLLERAMKIKLNWKACSLANLLLHLGIATRQGYTKYHSQLYSYFNQTASKLGGRTVFNLGFHEVVEAVEMMVEQTREVWSGVGTVRARHRGHRRRHLLHTNFADDIFP